MLDSRRGRLRACWTGLALSRRGHSCPYSAAGACRQDPLNKLHTHTHGPWDVLWGAAHPVALLCSFSLCWCGDHILFILREEFRTGFFRSSQPCSRGPRPFPPTLTPRGESPPAGASARVPVLTDRLLQGHRPSGRAPSLRVQVPHWPSSLGLGSESTAVQDARRPFKQNKCPFLTQRPQETLILLPKCFHRHL